MFSELKRLLRHSAVYGSASVLQKGIGFFMIPVYTHYLSPADYGILELLDLTINVITMLIGMRLGAALIRYYHRYESEQDRQEVFSTALMFIVPMVFMVVVLLEIFAKPIAGLILGDQDYYLYFQIMFVAMGLQTIAAVPESLLKAQVKSVHYSVITILTLVSYLTLNILFLVVFGWGLIGLLFSILITKIFNNLMLFIVVRADLVLRFSWQKLKGMILFSAPLIPASMAMFAIHFSDRFFVSHYCTLDDLGIYSLGYKFGMMIGFLVSAPFFKIWNTQRFEIAKRNNPGPTLSRFFSFYTLLVVFIGLGISVFSDEVVQIMAPAEYAGASSVIALIVLSYIFSGMATFFTLGTMLMYKNIYTAYIQVSTAGLNIVLNLLLIPQFGIMGAALSTVLTFLVLWIVTMLNSQRLYYLPLEIRRLASLVLVALLVYSAAFFVEQSLLVSIGFKALLMLSFPLLLWILGFFYAEELTRIKELLYDFRAKVMRPGPNANP